MHRVAESLLPKSPRAGERWLALTAMAWGLWLMLPFDAFAAGLSRTLLARMMGEDAWGAFALFIGAFVLTVSYTHWLKVRVAANVLLTVMWMFLAVVTLSVSIAPTGVLYLALGLQHATHVYDSILGWRGERWRTKA